MPAKRNPLAAYTAKRDFTATPEPAGPAKPRRTSRLRFVIQMHRATRLHYDFRLEANGVLASWAVPKGPSLDPADKRLAMHVEDHPFDYRTFEGVIPAGNYGAGEVIVWDEGSYTLAEGTDPAAEIAAGKIKFILKGKKIGGMFTLVKLRSKTAEENAWLLIKDHDEFEDPTWNAQDHAQSVKSQRTLADIAQSKTAKQWISDRKAEPKRASRAKPPSVVEMPQVERPMLATLVDEPFDDPRYLFEIKWDGYRALARIAADGTVTLSSRNGKDLLKRFSALRGIGAGFRSLPALVDGEIVSLDKTGRASFQRLQHGEGDLVFAAFDLLFGEGRDLRDEPLEARKAILEGAIVPGHAVMYSKHLVGEGTALFALAERQHIEGVMAKRRDSRYLSRRSKDWLKIKTAARQECVIGGWTEPRGSRAKFGALLLGVYDGKILRYAGHVGTGFDGKLLSDVAQRLAPLERATSPFRNTPKTNTKAHWVTPKLVAEVKFAEWTRDGMLRQPVFLGLREDKDAASVVRERTLAASDVRDDD